MFEQEEQAAMEANVDSFRDVNETFMAFKHLEVIPHFPPQYIVGKQVEPEPKDIAVKEHELVTIRL